MHVINGGPGNAAAMAFGEIFHGLRTNFFSFDFLFIIVSLKLNFI